MASQLNKYAQNIARARYATPTIPATGVRSSRAKISVSGDKGGAPSAKDAAAKVPTGVEPGEPTAPEYNPIIDAETMSPPVDPNRQEAIVNQARAPRFSIGNPNVGNIDLGSLLSSKANVAYDPNAPVGGANVPFQETKGVGGFFRRMFGDTANEQNVAAQQKQAEEWKAEGALAKQRQARKEDIAEEIRLREEGPTKRFESEQAARKAERATELEQRKGERAEDRADRLAREASALQQWRQERLDRATQQQLENEQRAEELGLKKGIAETPQVHATPGGGLFIMQPRSGAVSLVSPGTPGFGTIPAVPPSTRQVYPQPRMPVTTGGGGQVDRNTGATLGGGPLPPGAGVMAPGGTAATMGAAQPSAQPRYATISDQLLNLPGMGAIFDMPRVMTPERTARLSESKKLQESENLKRIRAMQEEAGRDIGPSMF